MRSLKPLVALSILIASSGVSLFAQAKCQPSKHAKLPLILNLTYHKARPKLIAAGWQPFPTIHHNEAAENQTTSHGNGRIFWRRGYWEVEFCSGTGLAQCLFLFEDAYGNRLRVSTAGEEFQKQGLRSCDRL